MIVPTKIIEFKKDLARELNVDIDAIDDEIFEITLKKINEHCALLPEAPLIYLDELNGQEGPDFGPILSEN